MLFRSSRDSPACRGAWSGSDSRCEPGRPPQRCLWAPKYFSTRTAATAHADSPPNAGAGGAGSSRPHWSNPLLHLYQPKHTPPQQLCSGAKCAHLSPDLHESDLRTSQSSVVVERSNRDRQDPVEAVLESGHVRLHELHPSALGDGVAGGGPLGQVIADLHTVGFAIVAGVPSLAEPSSAAIVTTGRAPT